jgi:thiol-disulfide isomerase/thioredoxin
MKPTQKGVLLGLTIGLIVVSVWWLESQKATPAGPQDLLEAINLTTGEVADKAATYPPAVELVGTQQFFNAEPFQLADHIGDKIIMIDFWTYSCINCQRTLPYLNAWHEKYADDGLLIVGVHTPEFEFEKQPENVAAAIAKYDIKYPVVQDNDYSTWRAYANRYWPRKYLIDIDGYVVYDHIGEGAYEETERVIQRLLKERQERLAAATTEAAPAAMPDDVSSAPVSPAGAETASYSSDRTPEIYFGAWRNELLGNGTPYTESEMLLLDLPPETSVSQFYLDGAWNITREYAENKSANAVIRLHYNARNVFMVAEADQPVTLRLTRDGEPLGDAVGQSVAADGTVTVQAPDLYRLIEDNAPGEHVLDIEILTPGLKAFTFTFG